MAGFSANIGDNANITGIQKVLIEDLGGDIQFTNEDMLGYKGNWGTKDYNSQRFVDLANGHDVLLIGGGGLFSPNPRQPTGCSVGITQDTIEKICVPIVYYALGYASYYGQRSDEAVNMHFHDYISYLAQNKNVLLSVRNDGSFARMLKVFDNSVLCAVSIVPDGGFFVPTESSIHKELPKNKPVIAIQLAGDKQQYRFQERNGYLSKVQRKLGFTNMDGQKRFLLAFAEVINKLHEQHNASFVFVPHIPSDLDIIHRFMSILPSSISRGSSTVAPIVTGNEICPLKYDFYKRVDMVIGMRFHSNVCPIGLGVPTIGLATHPQLPGLYEELNISNRCVDVNASNVYERLLSVADDTFNKRDNIIAEYQGIIGVLRVNAFNFHKKIEKLILVCNRA